MPSDKRTSTEGHRKIVERTERFDKDDKSTRNRTDRSNVFIVIEPGRPEKKNRGRNVLEFFEN